jgi:hypothetical protein
MTVFRQERWHEKEKRLITALRAASDRRRRAYSRRDRIGAESVHHVAEGRR